MKKITLIIALSFFSMLSFAQQPEESNYFRPLQGDIGASFNIAGIAAFALNSPADPLNNATLFGFRYFIKDYAAVRLGFGLNMLTTTTIQKTDPSTFPVSESEVVNTTNSFTIGLGYEKHLKTKSKRVDPFIGGGLTFHSLGKNSVTTTNKSTSSNGDFMESVNETVNPGGSLFVIGVNGGFFWYFAHNLALGGELGLGFGTGNQGGETTVDIKTTTKSGSNTSTTESHSKSQNDIQATGIRTLNTGLIEFLVKF